MAGSRLQLASCPLLVLFLSGFGHPLPSRRNLKALVIHQGQDPRRERPTISVVASSVKDPRPPSWARSGCYEVPVQSPAGR